MYALTNPFVQAYSDSKIYIFIPPFIYPYALLVINVLLLSEVALLVTC